MLLQEIYEENKLGNSKTPFLGECMKRQYHKHMHSPSSLSQFALMLELQLFLVCQVLPWAV
jgi:hypothetical protein